MFGEGPTSSNPPMSFVIAFRIDDDTRQKLMQRIADGGFKYSPEQIGRFALKRLLNEQAEA